MKFKLKVQGYQTDAVESTVAVFAGQPKHDRVTFMRDPGVQDGQALPFVPADSGEEAGLGYRNADVELSDAVLLQNIHAIQAQNNIMLSPPPREAAARTIYTTSLRTCFWRRT